MAGRRSCMLQKICPVTGSAVDGEIKCDQVANTTHAARVFVPYVNRAATVKEIEDGSVKANRTSDGENVNAQKASGDRPRNLTGIARDREAEGRGRSDGP